MAKGLLLGFPGNSEPQTPLVNTTAGQELAEEPPLKGSYIRQGADGY
jgi:hypothetical protein